MARCVDCGGQDTRLVETTLEGGILARRWHCRNCAVEFRELFERTGVEHCTEATATSPDGSGSRPARNGTGPDPQDTDPRPTSITLGPDGGQQTTTASQGTTTSCGAVDATVSHVHLESETTTGSLAVEQVQDEGRQRVRLGWSAGPVTVGTDLDPTQARTLAEQITEAATRARRAADGE